MLLNLSTQGRLLFFKKSHWLQMMKSTGWRRGGVGPYKQKCWTPNSLFTPPSPTSDLDLLLSFKNIIFSYIHISNQNTQPPDKDILPWMVQPQSAEPEQKGSTFQDIFAFTGTGLMKQIEQWMWNVKDNAGKPQPCLKRWWEQHRQKEKQKMSKPKQLHFLFFFFPLLFFSGDRE